LVLEQEFYETILKVIILMRITSYWR